MYMLMDAYGIPNRPQPAIDPLWPVFFCNSANLPSVANGLALFYMASSLLAVLWPHRRIARGLVFISMLEIIALQYSFGVLNQKEHWWLWSAFVFVFLPSASYITMLQSRSLRQHYLDIFSFAQGLMLLFYFLTGFWKLYYGILMLAQYNGLGIFSPNALPYLVAGRMANGHVSPFLSPYLIANPSLGTPLYLLVAYIELSSLIIWFRPSLHRLWGVMLIAFHIGTWLLMSIPFYLQPPLLAILFLHSPFVPAHTSCRLMILQVPGVAPVLRMWQYLSKNLSDHSK